MSSASAKRSPWPLWQWLRPVLVFEIVVLACLCGAGVFAQMGLHPDQPGRDSIAPLQALAIIFSRLQMLNVLFFLIALVLVARIIYRCAENVRWWITCAAGAVFSLLSEYMLRIVGQPFFLFAALSYASAAISSVLFIQIFNTLARAQHIRVERTDQRETAEAFS